MKIILMVVDGHQYVEYINNIYGIHQQMIQKVQIHHIYGDRNDKSLYYNRDRDIDDTFSIDFSTISFNEYLFTSGDGEHWIIIKKNDLIGKIGGPIPFTVQKSSVNSNVHTLSWYNRGNGNPEDPWISLYDHALNGIPDPYRNLI